MAAHAQTLIEPPAPTIIPFDTITSLNDNEPDSHDNVAQGIQEEGNPGGASHPVGLLQKGMVTFQLSGVNFTNNAVKGLVFVGLPTMAKDLTLPRSLAFWPASVAALATTATILLAGSLADVLGPRVTNLVGCFACGVFMLASGFVKTGEQLVALRALQGVGLALHLASSVALVTKVLPRGRGRNIAFSCLGMSQPLGFSFGLVIGGILVDTVGWRTGWYIYGSFILALSAIGIFSLPRSTPLKSFTRVVTDIRENVDWVGALLASSFMAFLSYFLSILSSNADRIRAADTIVFLCLGVLSLPIFLYWEHRQVHIEKPALIPNRLWLLKSFTAICAATALSFAVLNSLELFASLFFQEIQNLSGLQAAIRILPSLVVGTILNISTGFFVHKIPVIWIVTISALLTAGAPILMAVIQPSWPFWANAFIAQILTPISADILFTVGLIIISDVFPENRQALAGAVFNTATQFGTAFGLATMQTISALVSKDHVGMKPVEALMVGYRASFWTMFALMLGCSAVGFWGLRQTGKIGLKID